MKSKILRNGIAGAMLASVPLTATMAATRPNAAIPAASSAAVVAQSDDDDDGGVSFLALAAIGVAAAVAIWLILDDDDDGEGALSPG